MTQRHTYTTESGGSKRGPKACYVGALPCTTSLTGTRKAPTEAEIGGLAMLLAMRRASYSVSTFAMCASSGFSRE